MSSNIIENPGQSANTQRIMSRDSDMMLATLRSRQAHVTAGLTCNLIAKLPESLGEFRA